MGIGSAVIGTIISVLAGGAVAAATIVGVVQTQTAPPEKSPVDVHSVSIEYGSN